jgi:Holliday junction resolvase RusA-like endonuclease
MTSELPALRIEGDGNRHCTTDAIFDCEIPGSPVSKERARRGRNGRFYTPAKTRNAENTVVACVRQAIPGLQVDEASVFRVEVVFHTATRRRRDIDNMLKLLLDALNGVVWHDDSQIQEVSMSLSRNSANPRTVFSVFTIDKIVEEK